MNFKYIQAIIYTIMGIVGTISSILTGAIVVMMIYRLNFAVIFIGLTMIILLATVLIIGLFETLKVLKEWEQD